MRKVVAGLLLAVMGGVGVASAEVVVPVIENAGYSFCVGEANDALAVGRLVMVSRSSQAEVEGDAALPPYVRALATEFFQEQAAGNAPTYAHFALRRFRSCLARQEVRVDGDDRLVFACLTRMDIPYYFFALRRMGESRESATARIESWLGAWNYPAGLVAVVSEPAWDLPDEEALKGLQAFMLNSCLLPREQVSNYYGVEPPAAAPAGAAPRKGAGAKPRKK